MNPNSNQPAIVATNLRMSFGGICAVDNMSVTLKRGELLGLIGPNGAGKTTLFNMLAGSLKAQSGTIRINANDATGRDASTRIGMGLGRTFQIPKPFPEMTVLENVLTGAQDQAGEGLFANFLQLKKVAVQERAALQKARALLEFVTLTHLAQEPARILSGGQRKLLELARILMADPSIILLDEPAAGVNPALLEFIMSRVMELNAAGKSILLIEHNMDMIARLCTRVVVMAQGKFLVEGSPHEVARNGSVLDAYLGGAV